MIFLGVDLGGRRTGIAVCDPGETLASGVCTLTSNGKRALAAMILEKAAELGAEAFVVGDPVNMDGTRGASSENARAFGEELGRLSGLPVFMSDERCSTMVAHSIMDITDTRGKKRKERVDTLSAEIILQDFIDRRRAGRESAPSTAETDVPGP